ncbi:MAG: carbohydrate binding domain-containing protein [Treponema sp.]|nr:carbohydrate binding domain-containing protein [Treponema sp.]
MKKNTLLLSDKIAHKISPDMIGLFFEDINFAADGGLYAEMIENRSFEAIKSKGESHNYLLKEDNLYAWTAYPPNSACDESLEISCNEPVSEKNPHYLRFTAKKDGDGFKNKAYDGIFLKKGLKYKISFYAREVNYPEGKIAISIKKDGKIYGQTEIPFNNSKNRPKEWMDTIKVTCDTLEWKLYTAELTAEEDVEAADFVISLTKAGIIEFDLISMIPEDAVDGIFRKDLFQALADLHPAFVRFPGGCIVEGTSIMRRYQWKNTVGELKDRKINTNLWALQGGNVTSAWESPDCHYMQSYGIGFYEYFRLCELLSSEKRICKALPVLSVGVACQFRSYQTVPVDSEEFQKYVQDALDLIEFANGPVTSKWGSLRAQMGHPESFNMEMIAIGNEQWESGCVDLAPRYKAFEKAIHEKYPQIKCIGTAGPFVGNDFHKNAWDFYHKEAASNKDFSYAVDEHYYVAPQWLYDNTDFYDNYPRDVFVFAGEYAAHDENLSNSVDGAIAEAAMMTGMERNGDLVRLASYAPLFNRIGHSQWTPDMIWFDSKKVILTPTYYVQKLFSDFSGIEAFDLDGQEKTLRQNQIYISVVKAQNGKRIIKIANGSDEEQILSLTKADGNLLTGEAEIARLTAASGKAKKVVATDAIGSSGGTKGISPDFMSNLEVCKKRAPEEVICNLSKESFNGELTLPAKSFLVLVL